MLDEAERTLVNLLRGEAGSVAGEKYSFVRATDAEQIARAQELEAQGENAKTIWSETHLTRDGGGAWVQEINDHDAKPRPDGDARGKKGGRLADYLEHPELYEAVPGIADIRVELEKLPRGKRGIYSPQKRTLRFAEDTFKNKSMSDIMHEVQHAVQNEQKLAAGGSRKLAYAALVSDAYEAVKDNLPQALAAQGLTGGMSESALAGMYNSYGNNRNTIDRGRNESLAALLDTLNSNRSSALQSYNSQLSAAEQQKMAYQMQLEQALANGSAEILQNKYDTLQNLDNAYAQQILALQQAAAQAAQKRW